MGDSTPKVPLEKPSKPYPAFPLYAHASKRWAKKIRGRTHFFGHWNDWQAALERFQFEVDYLQQGKTPPPRDQTALTVGELANSFLAHRETKVKSGDLSPRTWTDYKRVASRLLESLGRHTTVESLQPSDFAKLREQMAERGGLLMLTSEMSRTKAIFRYCEKNYNIRANMGMGFEKPTRKAIKREVDAKPRRIFDVAELTELYQAANPTMRAFMLLAINGGMGNHDVGLLEFRHIQDGWVRFPRPKTLVDREFPLWSETTEAIEATKQTKGELPYVFVTKYGACWAKAAADDPISKEFTKLCKACELHQPGRGFYALRHTFRTVADGCRDQVAIDHVMGHADQSMGATYREWIDPERLQAVVDHVYEWCKPMFVAPKQ
ncbi:tyrosine-type recombinase/integrase [Rosistilla oblonga]|uniref:tyrosine-type recombinase/integrase n=1 Tax=Rosistilla oblonga TaxID=2527990 RepID=UPI003A97B7A6